MRSSSGARVSAWSFGCAWVVVGVVRRVARARVRRVARVWGVVARARLGAWVGVVGVGVVLARLVVWVGTWWGVACIGATHCSWLGATSGLRVGEFVGV